MGFVVVVDQRGDVGVDAQDHVSAMAAVSAVRATEWLELLAVDRRNSMPTATTGDMQRDPIDECRNGHGVSFQFSLRPI